MKHPYVVYEGTPLWRAIDAELAALEANGDLQVTTARAYIVGSLCKALAARKLTQPAATDSKAATPLASRRAR